MIREQQSKEHFDKWAEKYESSILQKIFFNPVQSTIIRKITESESIIKNREFKVLDVSCGTGKLLRKISELRENAVCRGIDLSEQMINIAKKKNLNKKNLNFLVANSLELPFENETFDYVTNTIAFHHYGGPQKAVNEMYRVAKKNGKIMITDMIYPIKLGKGAVKAYKPKEMKRFFENAGFEYIEQKRGADNFTIGSLMFLGGIIVDGIGTYYDNPVGYLGIASMIIGGVLAAPGFLTRINIGKK